MVSFAIMKMKDKIKKKGWKHIAKTVLCIALGTAAGIIVYGIFLYFKIAIFGWNLGLIFAPLTAGYVETITSRKFLGKDIGAISALILFFYTTFYSFILKNPTLGINIITAGSIIVILQAAFPTLINYILLVILGATASNLKWTFTNIRKKFKNNLTDNIRWETENKELTADDIPYFDEDASNKKLNSQNFFFITSTDMQNKSYEIIEHLQCEVVIENKDDISVKREIVENKRLVCIKNGKDECLMKLINTVKEKGGNGIVDLDIQYGLIGRGKDNIHITAMGMAIYLK